MEGWVRMEATDAGNLLPKSGTERCEAIAFLASSWFCTRGMFGSGSHRSLACRSAGNGLYASFASSVSQAIGALIRVLGPPILYI